jgi:hypothetical protein
VSKINFLYTLMILLFMLPSFWLGAMIELKSAGLAVLLAPLIVVQSYLSAWFYHKMLTWLVDGLELSQSKQALVYKGSTNQIFKLYILYVGLPSLVNSLNSILTNSVGLQAIVLVVVLVAMLFGYARFLRGMAKLVEYRGTPLAYTASVGALFWFWVKVGVVMIAAILGFGAIAMSLTTIILAQPNLSLTMGSIYVTLVWSVVMQVILLASFWVTYRYAKWVIGYLSHQADEPSEGDEFGTE